MTKKEAACAFMHTPLLGRNKKEPLGATLGESKYHLVKIARSSGVRTTL